MYQTLQYEARARVGRITLNQPERRNPLSRAAVAELGDVLGRAAADPQVRVLVLAGAGEAFCAGGDLREFAALAERPEQAGEDTHAAISLMMLLWGLRKPVVGAVNGAAYGGGLGLVAACHLAVASERARFALTEINVGLFPLTILPVVRSAVGDRTTLDLALTGRVIDAEEARHIGLVSRVVPHDSLGEAVAQLAFGLAARSPEAVEVGLAAYRETAFMDVRAAFRHLEPIRVALLQGDDAREGVRAFLEKRSARWRDS